MSPVMTEILSKLCSSRYRAVEGGIAIVQHEPSAAQHLVPTIILIISRLAAMDQRKYCYLVPILDQQFISVQNR